MRRALSQDNKKTISSEIPVPVFQIGNGRLQWVQDQSPRGLESYSSKMHALRRQRHLQESKHAVFVEQARQHLSNQRDDETLARQAESASRRPKAFASLLGAADAWAADEAYRKPHPDDCATAQKTSIHRQAGSLVRENDRAIHHERGAMAPLNAIEFTEIIIRQVESTNGIYKTFVPRLGGADAWAADETPRNPSLDSDDSEAGDTIEDTAESVCFIHGPPTLLQLRCGKNYTQTAVLTRPRHLRRVVNKETAVVKTNQKKKPRTAKGNTP